MCYQQCCNPGNFPNCCQDRKVLRNLECLQLLIFTRNVKGWKISRNIVDDSNTISEQIWSHCDQDPNLRIEQSDEDVFSSLLEKFQSRPTAVPLHTAPIGGQNLTSTFMFLGLFLTPMYFFVIVLPFPAGFINCGPFYQLNSRSGRES